MSDSEYSENQNESFWRIDEYKRVVKRTEDGYKLCNDLMQMVSERANIEKLYSKSLKQWSKKWNEYLEKCPEYGSMKQTWSSVTAESNSLSELHLQIHDGIEETMLTDIKAWQKQNYPKNMMNTLKIAKQYEEEFAKAQKPWAKKYVNVEKAKKEYHSSCKQLQSARINESNAKNDPAMSVEQKKKLEDKVEKHRKESENAKHKYKQALEELNEYNARYIEDMKGVYKKCDGFEKTRLDYFIQKFAQVHSTLDLTQKTQLHSIYGDFMSTIKSTNPENDLNSWSKKYGANMHMNWPAFEEYSEEFKNIAKGEKRSKVNEDNGITMTGIVKKDDSLPEPSSLRRRLSFFKRKSKRKSKTVSIISNSDNNLTTPSSINTDSLLRENKKTLSTTTAVTLPSSSPVNSNEKPNNNNNNNNKTHNDKRSSSNLESSKESIKPVTPRRYDTIEYPSGQNPFAEFSDEDEAAAVTANSTSNTSSSNSHASPPSTIIAANNTKTSGHKVVAPSKPTNDKHENESTLPQQQAHKPQQEESNPFGGSDSDSDDDTNITNQNKSSFNRVNSNGSHNNYGSSTTTPTSHSNGTISSLQQQQQLNIKVRAIYDYNSTEEDELTFKAGDEFVKLALEDDRGWCLGKIGSKIGLYPATYAVEQ